MAEYVAGLEGYHVAPFAGAWIEIQRPRKLALPAQSLPSRERGLK